MIDLTAILSNTSSDTLK